MTVLGHPRGVPVRAEIIALKGLDISAQGIALGNGWPPTKRLKIFRVGQVMSGPVGARLRTASQGSINFNQGEGLS